MNKATKIVLWVFASIAVLAIVAAIVLPMVLDPNDFRDDIAKAVDDRSGHELNIEGDLELSVLPWLGVDVGRVTLSNAPGFGEEPLMAFDSASVGVKLMPLLSRRVEVGTVRLDGLRLNLVRDEQGNENWAGLAESGEAEPEEAATDADAGQALALNEVAGIGLSDAIVRYVDRQEGKQLELTLAEFESGRIAGGVESQEVDSVDLDGLRLSYDGGAEGSYEVSLGNLSTGNVSVTDATPVVDGVELGQVEVTHDAGPADRYALSLQSLKTGRVVGDSDAPSVAGIELARASVEFVDDSGRYTAELDAIEIGDIGGTANAPEVGSIDLSGMVVGVESSDESRVRATIAGLNTGRIVANQDAPEIDSLKLENVEANLTAADGTTSTIQLASLGTGRVVGDPKSPVIGGIELRDATITQGGGEQGDLRMTIPEFTTGAVSSGQQVPVNGSVSAALGDPAIEVDARLTGQVSVDGPRVAIADLDLTADLSGDTIPDGSQTGKFGIKSMAVDQDAQTLVVEGVSLNILGLQVTGRANGEQISDAPVITGRLKVSEFSPRELMGTLGIEVPATADPAVLSKAALDARFRSAPKRSGLNGITMQLDDTSITGNVSATMGDTTAVKAKLDVDGIDLDRYLPPESDSVETDTTTDTEIPAEDLKAVNVEAQLKIGRLKAAGLRMDNVDAGMTLRRGALRITPMTADFYGGKLDGLVALTTRESPPRLKLKQTLSDVQLEPMLRDLAEVDAMTGTARLNIDVAATGATSNQMLSNLDGRVGFRVQDGILRGVNITYELQRALALIKRRQAPERTSNDTPFRNISGKGLIAQGVLSNDDLVVAAPGLKLSGAGKADLGQDRIDYDLTAEVPKGRQATQAGLDDLVGKQIPVKVSGPLSDPSVRPDLGKLIGDEVGNFIKNQLGLGGDKDQKDGAEGQEDEEKEDSLEDALKDLLGK